VVLKPLQEMFSGLLPPPPPPLPGGATLTVVVTAFAAPFALLGVTEKVVVDVIDALPNDELLAFPEAGADHEKPLAAVPLHEAVS